MRKVTFISNIIAPYRISFFNELSKCDNIKLNVLYIAENEKNRKWSIDKQNIEYSYKVIKGIHIPYFFKVGTIHISYNYNYFLDVTNPDVIVLGTDLIGSTISIGVIRYAKRKGIKLIRYEGQHCYNYTISSFKLFIYKKFYNNFDGFFVYSQLTKKYLIEKFNISKNLINVGYNVGDLRKFSKINFKKKNEKRIKLLFCGYLNKRKNILFLMNILKNNFDSEDFIFTIVGDGPDFNDVKSLSESFKNMKIEIKGNIYNDELLEEYKTADIFILPSLYDPASIVVTESLSAGLFTIGSQFDGSAINFIRDKINGIIINPFDKCSIIDALNWSLNYINSKDYNKLLIRESMKKYTLKNYVKRLSEWQIIK